VLACEDALAALDDTLAANLWCELLLGDAILCVADADTRLATQELAGEGAPVSRGNGDAIAALYGTLRRARLPMVFTSDQPPSTQELDRPPHVMRFGAATAADTLALWRAKLPESESVEEVSTRFRLTPGRIVRAAEAARSIAQSFGRAVVQHRDVAQAIRVSVAQQVAVLGNLVEDSQTWDDIVLPDDTRASVQELIARVKHRHTVLDEWGFRTKMSKGLGMAALFSGPPGTGKTMVASLIARELGQELYQIDLSRVVSKWIGETEKNLSRVFDAAEGANVLLLFDEADSLFAKRTEVKSSNDRHANAEVNYLLQRVERFEGICILTTNFEGSIDPAFKRRLAFRMIFPLPDETERTELWRRMMPKTAHVADDVDFAELGADYELAGGNIRNAVLRAAFLAANEHAPISRELLLRAIRLEYRDAGKFTTAGRII
jgi:ATP-dependent 26S proteasome regulatory subunit